MAFISGKRDINALAASSSTNEMPPAGVAGTASIQQQQQDARAPTPRMHQHPQLVNNNTNNNSGAGLMTAQQNPYALLMNQQQQNNYAAALAAAAASSPQSVMQQQQQQLQLALSQLLLNPGTAAQPNIAQLLNPANAMAFYYSQLAALIQQQAQPPPQSMMLVQQPAPIRKSSTDLIALQQQLVRASVPPTSGQQPHPELRYSSSGVASSSTNTTTTTTNHHNHQQRPLGPMASPEAVKDHISRLISENEAILEPNPMLLKRRPYHRQPITAQNSANSLLDGSVGSPQCNSPGIAITTTTSAMVVREKTPATRSQSLFEPLPAQRHLFSGGSITTGQPIIKMAPSAAAASFPSCNFCQVKFANEAALDAHEYRCSRRFNGGGTRTGEVIFSAGSTAPVGSTTPAASSSPLIVDRKASSDTSAPHVNGVCPDNRHHPLKKRLLAAAAAAESDGDKRKHKVARMMNDESAAGPMMVEPAVTRRQSMPESILRPHVLAAAAAKPSPTPLPMPPMVTMTAADLSLNFKPYCLTLSQSLSKAADSSSLSPKVRNRPRHITMETFVCLKRPQPMFVEQKDRLSMYSHWQQVPTTPVDSKLNLMWMSCCSTKPRRGVKPYWRYTTANKELGTLRVTHSSFLEISNKLRARQSLLTHMTTPSSVVEPNLGKLFINTDPACKRDLGDLAGANAHDPIIDVVNISSCSSGSPSQIASSMSIKSEMNMMEAEEKAAPVTSAAAVATTVSGTPICMGGYRASVDEVYVYVRGRGRGRYVCERCGIRCKKPSMLKKHIRSHTDVRPFKCQQCNFSFKTKGNLTKHQQSKSHRRRINENGMPNDSDSDENDRLEIASPALTDETNSIDSECITDNDDDDDDDEDDEYGRQQPFLYHSNISYKKFGQENILFARSAHTPPTLWMYRDESGIESFWPKIHDERHTHSAPPSTAIVSPSIPKKSRRIRTEKSSSSSRRQLSTIADAVPVASITSKLSEPTTDIKPIFPIGTFPGASSSSSASPHSISQYLIDEPARCNKCDKVFRKASELKYHEHVHSVGNNASRRYTYPCPECKQPQRSKPSLQKHIETNHPELSVDSINNCDERSSDGDDFSRIAAGPSPSSTSTTINVMTSSSALSGGGNGAGRGNPRPFQCTDCATGFRIHGHLAKHLRSKIHVMKLEGQAKLPEGTFHLIETSGGGCLNDVDTTDCDRARTSLLALARTLGAGEISSTVGHQQQRSTGASSSSSSSSSSSLECAEEMLAPSPAPMLVTTPRLRCDSMPTKVLVDDVNKSVRRPRCETISVSSTISSASSIDKLDHQLVDDDVVQPITINNRHISANVWIPPRAEQLPSDNSLRHRHRPISIASSSSSSIAAARLLLEAAAICDKAAANSLDDSASDVGSDESITPNHQKLVPGAAAAIVVNSATGIGNCRPSICRFCDANFETLIDLEVHLHADHIVMRDGNDFKCPKKHCDRVYPDRENLRQHIAAHYHGGGAALTDGREDDRDTNTAAPFSTDIINAVDTMHRKLTGSNSNQHAPLVPNRSPGHPEESLTASSQQRQLLKCSIRSSHLVKLDSIPEGVPPGSTVGADFKSPPNNSPLSLNNGVGGGDSNSSSDSLSSPILAPSGRHQLKRKSLDDASTPIRTPCSSSIARSVSAPTTLPPSSINCQHQSPPPVQQSSSCWTNNDQTILATYLMQMQQQQSVINASSSLLPCAVCGCQFDNAISLQHHWLTHISDPRTHICRRCDAGFTSADALRSHMATHS